MAQTKKAEILCYLKHRTTSNKIQNQLKLQTDTLTTEMSTLIGIFTNQNTFTSWEILFSSKIKLNKTKIMYSNLVFPWGIWGFFSQFIIFFHITTTSFSLIFLGLSFPRTYHHCINIVLGVCIYVHCDQTIRHKILNGLKTLLPCCKIKLGVSFVIQWSWTPVLQMLCRSWNETRETEVFI